MVPVRASCTVRAGFTSVQDENRATAPTRFSILAVIQVIEYRRAAAAAQGLPTKSEPHHAHENDINEGLLYVLGSKVEGSQSE